MCITRVMTVVIALKNRGETDETLYRVSRAGEAGNGSITAVLPLLDRE